MYIRGEKYKQTMKQEYSKKESVKSILQYPVADLTDREIREEISEKFNIRMSVSEEDGKTPTALYFPYYNAKSQLSGWKRRDLTLEKTDDYYFTTIGKVGVDSLMFGQKEAQEIQGKRSKLKICEGEIDHLSAYQASLDSVKGTKWEGLEPHIVSVSCGTANAADSCLHNLAFIESFTSCHLAFDNDEATPKERQKGIMRGKEATEAVASVLLHCDLWICEFPPGTKDCNDMLVDGRWKELSKLLAFPTKKFAAEKIIRSGEFDFEEVIRKREAGVMISTFPKLMEKLKGFRKREMAVLTALSGVGKSYVCSEIAYSMAFENNWRVGMIFLEEDKTETFQRLMARYLEIPYNKFKFDPQAYASKERLKEAFDWVSNNDKFVMLDHFGSLAVEELMAKIRFMYLVEKVDYIILDHISLLISGLNVKDERKSIDMALTEMAGFVKSNDVGIMVVSHLNRDASDEIKGISKMTEPMWISTKKENLRGSSSIEGLAWIILALDFELMPDKTRGRVRLVVLKNRPTSTLGIADTFKANDETGLLEDQSYDNY